MISTDLEAAMGMRLVSSGLLMLSVIVGSTCFAQDLVENGRFNTGVASWVELSGIDLTWDASDCHLNPGSGSAQLSSLATGENTGAIQCVSEGIVAGRSYDLQASLRVPTGQGGLGRAMVFVWWHDDLNCAGSPLTGPLTGSIAASNVWVEVEARNALAPAGAQSATVYLNLLNESAPPGFTAFFDSVTLAPSGLVFWDDFESNIPGEWSAAAP